MSFIGILVLAFVGFLATCVKVLNEYERAVVFSLGRVTGARGPGLIILIPWIETMSRVDLRTVTMDVPPQDVITRDNVTLKVNAVVYFRVVDAVKSVVEVANFYMATSQLAQTTLRSVLGQAELDELLSSRETLNQRLEKILDTQTEPWGVKISHVEVKQIDLPVEMQRAMAKQAEAERERRAKIIGAQGELEASQKLGEAAEIMAKNPISLQLRYLQTLQEMSSESATNTIIPLPLEILKPFLKIPN